MQILYHFTWGAWVLWFPKENMKPISQRWQDNCFHHFKISQSLKSPENYYYYLKSLHRTISWLEKYMIKSNGIVYFHLLLTWKQEDKAFLFHECGISPLFLVWGQVFWQYVWVYLVSDSLSLSAHFLMKTIEGVHVCVYVYVNIWTRKRRFWEDPMPNT